MKLLRYSLLALCLLLVAAPQAFAALGWAGNVWPNSGSIQVPTGPITVYAQAWKGGTTDSPGQGADIAATLYYKTNLMGAEASVAMIYNGDVGNNDEYKGDVPQAALAGTQYVDVRVVFLDQTDNAEYASVNDQASNGPPQRYNITNVTPNAIDVTFTLCMSGTATTGEPCVIGGQAPIGNWGTGVTMTQVSGELYRVTVSFPAGSNPAFEYKYKADGCTNWESVGNRAVMLPTDGTTAVNLATDSFNNAPLGCNQGQTLSEGKQVCFQLCLAGVEHTGNACVIGSGDQLSNWGSGVTMSAIGTDLFQVCVTYPAGTAIPLNVEYKFKKDDCGTWESAANRSLTIDNSTPSSQTITKSWDDGTGACAPVKTNVTTTWGSLKSLYR
jgi:hypothetical protein